MPPIIEKSSLLRQVIRGRQAPLLLVLVLSLSSFANAFAQSTVQQAEAKAVQLYPDLATKDSPLNKQYVALYNQKRASNPDFFSDPQWPLILAKDAEAAITPASTPPQQSDTPQPDAASSPTPAPLGDDQDQSPAFTAAMEKVKQAVATTLETTQMDKDISLDYKSSLDGDQANVHVEVTLLSADAKKAYKDGSINFATIPAIQQITDGTLTENGFPHEHVTISIDPKSR